MKKFLKILATPFVALWRWIKETAWVQPLLIVGVIFAVIFSIPSITNWVKSWDFGSDKYQWLYAQQLSLEGVKGTENSGEAYDFMTKFNDAQNKWSSNDRAGAKETLKDYVGDDGKMMLYFAKEDSTCENVNEASNYLVNEVWESRVNDPYKAEHDVNAPAFKYKTIFADQTIDVDEKDHTYDEHTPYEYLLVSKEYRTFASTVIAAAVQSNYYINLESSNAKTTLENNAEDIVTSTSIVPFYVTIDLTDFNASQYIVTNVFFNMEGSTKSDRANFLAHAWINTEEFKPQKAN